jgi:FMN-dependent NADH-azoreductase
MATLLYIEASPRGARSHSSQAASAFLDAYVQSHPQDRIVKLDLWTLDLPTYDGAVLDAKYSALAGAAMPPEQAAAWAATRVLVDQFKHADRLVISSPMWNFSLPYRLKHYIDVITQPGMLWSFDPATGYSGLAGDRPTLLIQSAAGSYDAASGAQSLDHLSSYLATWLDFIGIKDRRTLWVAPTFADEAALAQTKAHALETAIGLARQF